MPHLLNSTLLLHTIFTRSYTEIILQLLNRHLRGFFFQTPHPVLLNLNGFWTVLWEHNEEVNLVFGTEIYRVIGHNRCFRKTTDCSMKMFHHRSSGSAKYLWKICSIGNTFQGFGGEMRIVSNDPHLTTKALQMIF